MEVVRLVVLAGLAACSAYAADFSMEIGNPVAANTATKTASLAVRLANCADLPKARLNAVAEGLVDGMRKSVALRVVSGAPGVYAVAHDWPNDGTWVVNLTATCGDAKAGAVVPFRGSAFLRESTRFFPRFATAGEVELSLKELAGGAK
jgi:hypothetical protein